MNLLCHFQRSWPPIAGLVYLSRLGLFRWLIRFYFYKGMDMVNTREVHSWSSEIAVVQTSSSWPCLKALERLIKGPDDRPFSFIFVHLLVGLSILARKQKGVYDSPLQPKENDCVRFFFFFCLLSTLSLLLNHLEKRYITASDNPHIGDQLILRHPVSNYSICGTKQHSSHCLMYWMLSCLVKCIKHWILCFLDTVQWRLHSL